MADERKTPTEIVREGIRNLPGMLWNNLKKAPGDIADTLSHKTAQGAAELASAFHTGNAFVQYGDQGFPPAEPQAGVHGPQEPPTVEQRAENVIDLQEAKQAIQMERSIDREVAAMSPEEQRIAANFREPTPQQQELNASERWRERARPAPEQGKERGMSR